MAIALIVVACSSTDKKEQAPAPLPDFKAEREFDKLWSHGIGNGDGKLYNRLTPAIHEQKIVAAAANGKVEAYDRISGRSLWDADIDQPICGGVGIGGGLVLVATEDGRLWALDESNGKTLWKTQLEGQVLAPPQSDGNIVVAVTFSGDLVGLDAKTGAKKWLYAGGSPVLSLRASSTPVLYDTVAITGLSNGKVIAVELASGQPVWETRVGVAQGSSEIERQNDVAGNLLIDDDILYAVSFQGRLAALDLHSGRRLWETNASSYVGLSTGFSNIYVVAASGNITAFTKNNQGARWEQTALARRQLSGSAVLDSYVLVGDFEGYLLALSQIDGHFVAREHVGGDGLRVAPIVVDDIAYVYSNGGKLAAYKLEKR
ncbi:MAG TPA: outer membrane protein assembly factor BamB [Spongiibacteraceae bacterium]|nr:outer membrane protein assembly factor BamB [Spongiibacteraceae bacterium]